jgi:hypothetical protein
VSELVVTHWAGSSSCKCALLSCCGGSTNSIKILLLDISNLCSCSICTPQISTPVYPTSDYLFIWSHHSGSIDNVSAISLCALDTIHQWPASPNIPKILCSEHLHSISCRMRLYDSFLGLDSCFALRSKQRSVPLLHL